MYTEYIDFTLILANFHADLNIILLYPLSKNSHSLRTQPNGKMPRCLSIAITSCTLSSSVC